MAVAAKWILSLILVSLTVFLVSMTVRIARSVLTTKIVVFQTNQAVLVIVVVIIQRIRALVTLGSATWIQIVVVDVEDVMIKNGWFRKITDNSEIAMWSLPEGAIARLGQGVLMGDIAPSPDGKYLAVASRIGVWWYDVATMTPISLWNTDRGFISAVSFSPNGKWLATADGDGLVKVWDVQKGVCITQIESEKAGRPDHSMVSRLVFSPNSQLLAVSKFRDYTLDIWHSETGERFAKLHNPPKKVRWQGTLPRPIAFSADGCLLACTMPDDSLVVHAGSNANIRLPKDSTEFIAVWNIETGNQLACLTDTEGLVQSLCFSPCGRFLTSGGHNGSVMAWSVVNWQRTQHYLGFGTGEMQVFYSPTGVLHAAGTSNDTLVVWNVMRGEKCDLSLGVHNYLQGPHVPRGTPFILASATRREFKKWRVDNSEPRSFHHLHTGVPFSLVFALDGNTLIGGYWGEKEKVMLWDIVHPTSPPNCFNLPRGVNYIVSISPEESIYATGHDGITTKVWNIGNNETPIAIFTLADEKGPFVEQQRKVSTAAFAPKNNLLACGDSEGTLYMSDLQQQKIFHTLKAHSEWIKFIAFSPDEKKIMSMTRSGYVSRLWDVENGVPLETFPERIYAFAFSPCSTLIALAQRKKFLLWDISRRETVRSLFPPKDSGSPFALTFSHCGQYLASGATWVRGIKKCPVLLWDVERGENIAAFKGHSTDVQDLAFSPDGTLLASGSFDGTILLWDLKPYL